MQIPDDVLSSTGRTIDKSQTFDRLTVALEEKLVDSDSRARTLEGVKALRAANQARADVQHGNGALVASSLQKLGVRYEPGDWAGNWDAIRRGIAHALAVVRRELQTLT
jgi:hypothetical protein